MKKKKNAVLVVGAGIGGMRAALDLAGLGFKVYLLDRSSAIGGTLSQLDQWYPTDTCEMCQILPSICDDQVSQLCLRRELNHPNIELIPYAEVEMLDGTVGDFTVSVRRKARYVAPERCIACDLCVEVCPVEVEDEFNEGLSRRKAVYIKYPHAVPDVYTIDMEHCTKCGLCVEKCPTNAIDLSQKDRIEDLKVGAVVLAPGFEEFDPHELSQYGYGHLPDVLTSIEFERLISSSRPEGGTLLRPSTGEMPRRIAFLQCVGSRDQRRNFCSSACCMYALKEATLIKELNPEAEISFFLMDMRAFGKGYHRYYQRAKDELGVKFVRCRVPAVKEAASGGVTVGYETEEGRYVEEGFDMVVLSVGQKPPADVEKISQAFGIDLNEHGFCRTQASPVRTTVDGIFVCGSFSEPKDIPETVTEATATAQEVSLVLAPEQPLGATFPDERVTEDEDPRVAVFLCRCGDEVAGSIDLKEVRDQMAGTPDVVVAEEVDYLCLQDDLEHVKERLRETGANRVVFGACVPYHYDAIFRKAVQEVGLSPVLVERVNLREQLSWVHADKETATEKAKRMVAMAVAKTKLQRPLSSFEEEVQPRALVIGGGLAGMTAALALAGQGIDVDLVERENELGGHLKDIYLSLDGSNPQELLQEMRQLIKKSKGIHVHVESSVEEVTGLPGSFRTVIGRPKGSEIREHGAIIVATGADSYRPEEYGYGEDQHIITQKDLENRLASGDLDPSTLKSVVMIQCVGSREKDRPYCSRICCAQALKNAIAIKERSPTTEVFVLYRDLMAYGFRELSYTKARDKGVIFIRFEEEDKPHVDLEGGVRVVVKDSILGERLALKPDLLVLSPGIVAGDNRRLAELLDVSLDQDGFFQEANVKFRPVDFIKDGIYACGLAHSPRSMEESVVQAKAAACRAAWLLNKKRLPSRRFVSEVNERRCAGCELCISTCPFNSRFLDFERKVARVKEVLCQGCGVCAMICPNNAATLRGFKENQIFSMIDEAM